MHLRIDYDPKSRELVFSEETENYVGNPWKSRVYDKTRSVQIRLLQDYGSAQGNHRVHAVEREGAKEPDANSQSCKPLCVCGAHMERLDMNSRISSMLEDLGESWRSRIVESGRALNGLITCDICKKNALTGQHVWTCPSGVRTVLHPCAYDVCEKCFLTHTSDKDDTTPNRSRGFGYAGFPILRQRGFRAFGP